MKSSSILNVSLQISSVTAMVIVTLSLALCVVATQPSLRSDGSVAEQAVEISHEYFCSDSDSFCFPSTLMSSPKDQELRSTNGEFSQDTSHTTVHELRNSENIRCSSVDFVNYNLDSYSVDCNHTFESLKRLTPDVWMRSLIGKKFTLHEHKEQIVPVDTSSSSMPFMRISPPSLDWGVKNLYSPSLAFLKVANWYNESTIDVFEPFSSDPQFYAHEFSQISLSPGEAALIPFIFLPRQLGSSSAHIVLQTSIGGFIIQAMGSAVESPYGAKAWVANASSCRTLSRKFSLHNPFEDVLYIEEVAAWTWFLHGNESKSSQVLCSKEVHSKFRRGESAFTDPNWFVSNSDDVGLLSVGFTPHGDWKLPSNGAEAILEMDVRPCMEGKIFGAVCLQLHSSRTKEHDLVIVPYEIEIQDITTYHGALVSASWELLVPCNARESKFVLSVKNRSPYFLSVVNVHETTEKLKLFKITFIKGLLLYPGSETHIALVSFSSESDPQIPQHKDYAEALDCKILINANDSASPLIEIPCHDLIDACSEKDFAVTTSVHDTCIGMRMQQEKPMNAKTSSLHCNVEELLYIESKRSEFMDVDKFVLDNWRSQGTRTEGSVLQDHEILFPVVQVGRCSSRWITIHNPYEEPVVMQLLLSSAVIVHRCQSIEDTAKESFAYGEYHSDFMQLRYGFSIKESALTETVVEPFGLAALGPVVFCPSAQCTWRSSAIVRNNLSGVEWLPLRAFGGSHSITLLEGSEPVNELKFKPVFPVDLNLSSPKSQHNMEDYNASCAHLLFKEIYAKNTGMVPLEVIKLGVSGGGCKQGGFMIHTCDGFALSPGESVKLQISYQASDHSTSVFRRDLEMVMASGVHVIPMIAILPNEMLKICRKTSWNVHFAKPFFLVLFVTVPIVYFAFSKFKHFFSSSSDGHVKFDNTLVKISNTRKSSRPHCSTRKARLHKEDVQSVLGEEALGNHGKKAQSASSSPRAVPNRTQGIQAEGILRHHEKKEILTPSLPSTTPNGCQSNHSKEVSVQEKKPQPPPSSSSPVQNGTRDIHGEDSLYLHDKKSPPPLSSSMGLEGSVGRPDNRNTTEKVNLTVKVGKEKRKRRKERGSRAGLASKFEVSSSHSGNSTPSSPLSPNISTPRDAWSVSSDNLDSPSGQGSFSKKQDSVARTDVRISEASGNNYLPTHACKGPRAAVTSLLKPSDPPSVELLFTNLIAPGIHAKSAIALHARAPGANLAKERYAKGGVACKEEFVYDIWGNNHLGNHLVGEQKVHDASEGGNHSFFSRDPQKTLMMMPSARSVSPGHNVPFCNAADYYNEMK